MESNGRGLPHFEFKGYHEPLQTYCMGSCVEGLGRGEKMFMSIICVSSMHMVVQKLSAGLAIYQ